MKAPRTWPNISLSKSCGGTPPRFTRTKGPARRRLLRWIASATTSLPVPLSPVIRTEASVGAMRPASSSTCIRRGSSPTMPARSYRASSSAREGGASPAAGPGAAARSRAVCTAWRIWSLPHGLVMKSAAPAFMPSTASSIDPQAVISSTGSSGRRVLMSRSSRRPSSPEVAREKFMSCSTRRRSPRPRAASASAGPAAATVACPPCLSSRESDAVTAGSSSTIRIMTSPATGYSCCSARAGWTRVASQLG